ncbi:dihydrolipoyl dehydrogenase [Ectobacillus ponti]|uniref:Dihydrolipoyl dehydrogenase n=1 Tax=Ectobacillus ponti TaxID=2961894 RepID=A0AA41X8L3_9BACI|nr:dihydrolipoyl dehydrogenase [Ectobacillus ponti]MCP8967396.1 dihydrolipoyl dehydrogenase [Ectobacillus ponti]
MAAIAVIGGGPAGYVAAITAAGQGHRVMLIDNGPLGGTCLNEGCIPTKSLLESAEMYDRVNHAAEFGITLPPGQVQIDWQQVQQRKRKVVQTLVNGVNYLMKKNRIEVIAGRASFRTSRLLAVHSSNGEQLIEADRFIIAAGSEPIALPFAPFDGEWILHSGQAMSLSAIPESLLIIGGGVIGCEFASIYSRMGTKVTMVEMAEHILPGEDADIAAVLQGELEQAGVATYTSAALQDLERGQKKAVIQTKQGVQEVYSEHVLVSVGRKPRLEDLNLPAAGVNSSPKGILVNGHMQTSIPHIYACGDVIGGVQLAHVAFHEGTVAALNACGQEAEVNYRAVPRCVYTSPEIAGVGLTEKQARDTYGEIRVGEFPFAANGKALILNQPIGKVKVIIEPHHQEILGVSIVGPHATELIGQGSVMLQAELTVDSMQDFIAAHPTLSEAIQEALLSAIGHAVHV